MFRKNVAGQFIHVQGVDVTTGGSKTGVAWTVRRCLDGSFAAATGTASEDGVTGWYKFALSQADTDGHNCGFNFTGAGAVPQTVNFVTAAHTLEDLSDAVWDEVLTSAAHTTANSAGMRLKTLGTVIHASVVDATPAAANFDTDLTNATDNFYHDMTVRFTSGNLSGISRIVYSYTGSSKTVFFDEPFSEAPANGDTFDLIAIHSHTISEIADYSANAVWNTDATGHQTQGTFGQAIGDPAADANTIYQAVVSDANGATVGVDTTAIKVATASILVDTTDIAAIKAKTDSLAFTVPGEVDANIHSVNNANVTGTGVPGDEWGP